MSHGRVGTDVWPEYGLFVWPMMVICVDFFMSISYATIGRENQVVFACFLLTCLEMIVDRMLIYEL